MQVVFPGNETIGYLEDEHGIAMHAQFSSHVQAGKNEQIVSDMLGCCLTLLLESHRDALQRCYGNSYGPDGSCSHGLGEFEEGVGVYLKGQISILEANLHSVTRLCQHRG